MMLSSKRREEAELDMISCYLADGGTFVDIGANIGHYALNANAFKAKSDRIETKSHDFDTPK